MLWPAFQTIHPLYSTKLLSQFTWAPAVFIGSLHFQNLQLPAVIAASTLEWPMRPSQGTRTDDVETNRFSLACVVNTGDDKLSFSSGKHLCTHTSTLKLFWLCATFLSLLLFLLSPSLHSFLMSRPFLVISTTIDNPTSLFAYFLIVQHFYYWKYVRKVKNSTVDTM